MRAMLAAHRYVARSATSSSRLLRSLASAHAHSQAQALTPSALSAVSSMNLLSGPKAKYAARSNSTRITRVPLATLLSRRAFSTCASGPLRAALTCPLRADDDQVPSSTSRMTLGFCFHFTSINTLPASCILSLPWFSDNILSRRGFLTEY